MSKNKWQSYKHDEVDRWDAIFKYPEMQDLSLVLAFLTGVLKAGEREHVLTIEEADGEFTYHKSMGISYAQHMNNVFEKYGKILPVEDSCPVSHLCYYDIDGNLTEGDISSMGSLLTEVVPYEELKDYQWYGNSPLGIYCDYYLPDPKYYPASTGYLPDGGTVFYLTIYTKTDIWRPQTYLSDDDNIELAMCHTPRLNRFLAEFKRLTLEYGGEWLYSDGIVLP